MILAQIKAYVVPAMLSALVGLFMLWRGAVHDGEQAKELARTQGMLLAAQSRISQYEEQIDNRVAPIVQRIMESPDADTPIPTDIASLWADGIDSLRDSEAGSARGHEKLQGPGSDSTASRGFDAGRDTSVLKPTGSVVPKV